MPKILAVRILIDILHPAHVHVFRNFRMEMLGRGHDVLVTARDKDVTIDLLEAFDIPYVTLSTQRPGKVRLAAELVARTVRLIAIARETRPDVITGIMGPSAVLAGKVLRIPSVVLYDTEIAGITNSWVYPLATHVLTPTSYQGKVRGSHITYQGFHELAYLHPSRFTPDESALADFGVRSGEDIAIVRFVSWTASHDRRTGGLTGDQKRAIISVLSDSYRVLVSAEGDLPPDMEDLRLKGPVYKIHHLMAHAKVVVGESATMTSEAAILGVPAFYVAEESRGYLEAQHEAGLVEVFHPDELHRLLDDLTGLHNREQVRHRGDYRRFLDLYIDVTEWLSDWFEDFHSSRTLPAPEDLGSDE